MKRAKLVRDRVELKPTNDGYAVLNCEVMRKAIETMNPARVALDLDNIITNSGGGKI